MKLFQKDLAQQLGTDKDSIHNWERGHAAPSLYFIPRIIEFLGYNPFETKTESPAEEIETYRRTLGLTQKELARRLKIDPCTLAKWERGKGRPSKEFLQTLIDFFASLSTSSKTSNRDVSFPI